MQETKQVLGKVELVAVHVSGTKKDGSEFAFDRFAIKIDDVEIGINPRTEDKTLFEYKLGKVGK